MREKAEWLTDKYILIMLLVYPLWTGFHGYSRLTLSKFVFFVCVTGLWLSGLLICLIQDKKLLARPRPAQLCALAFMAVCCLSAALSPFGADTLLGAGRYDGLVTLLLYGFIFLGVSAFGQPKRLYVYSLAGAASVCCIIAVLQLCRINVLGLFPDGLCYYDANVKYSGEFLGTIGNTDLLAAYLALCIPPMVALPIVSKKGRDFWLLIPAALCHFIVFRSKVASGILALACGVLICAPFLSSASPGRKKATKALAGISFSIAVLGLITAYFWPGKTGTMWELSQVLHGNIQDSFGSSRILIWRECLDIAAQRPLLGGGPDTLSVRTELGFSRYVAETGATLRNHVDNAHNEYLGYLVNTGVLGLLSYLSLVCAVLVTAFRRRRGAVVAPVIACGLVCYLIQSFFGLGLCIVVPLCWIFMGLLCSRMEDIK